VALNDPFVDSPREEVQPGREQEISCLRLPAKDSWSDRIAAAQVYAYKFAPDWLSWQLVPYGFHPKGIIPKEARELKKLCAGRHNQVLLHELWIGLSAGESFKNRLWGWLQRRAFSPFLESLQPEVLQTTNATYKIVLERNGWTAAVLPLFGNIPVAQPMPPMPDPHRWSGCIFGTVHPQFDLRCFDTLIAGAQVSQRKLRILGFGRLGEYGEKMFAELETRYSGKLEIAVLGEKSPVEISLLFQALDFGLATHPWALAGKSGAVAAMLDHGLPVIVPRDDWALRRNPVHVSAIDPLMIKLSEMPPELMAGRLARRHPPTPRLPAVAAAFLSSLGAIQTSPAFTK
jgi:hypothetical protein